MNKRKTKIRRGDLVQWILDKDIGIVVKVGDVNPDIGFGQQHDVGLQICWRDSGLDICIGGYSYCNFKLLSHAENEST